VLGDERFFSSTRNHPGDAGAQRAPIAKAAPENTSAGAGKLF